MDKYAWIHQDIKSFSTSFLIKSGTQCAFKACGLGGFPFLSVPVTNMAFTGLDLPYCLQFFTL